MRPSRLRPSLLACGVWASILLAPVQQAAAHFLWLLPPESGTSKFSLVFSEGLHPDDPALLAKMRETKVTLWNAAGEKREVHLTLEDDRLTGNIPDGFTAVAMECQQTWGMFSRGTSEFLLKYRALSVIDIQASEKLKLAASEQDGPVIQLTKSSQGIALAASFQVNPLAKTTVSVLGSGSAELTLDEQGKTAWQPAQPGLYGLRVKATQKISGEAEGKTYSEVRHYTTLTVAIKDSVNAKAKDAEYPALPETITSFGAVRLGDSLFAFGGHTGTAHSYSNVGQTKDLIKLDLNHLEAGWQTVSQRTRLQGLGMVAYEDKVIVVGGFNARNEEGAEHDLHSTDAVTAFDTKSGEWTELPKLPEPRSSHDAAIVGSTVYVVGGWQLKTPEESQWHTTAWGMDLAAESPQWKEIASPPFVRRALALAEHQGKLYAIGGMNRDGGPTLDVEVYDPAKNTWSDGPALLGSKPLAGFGAAAIAIGNRLTVTTMEGKIEQLAEDGLSWKIIGETEAGRFFHRMLPLDETRALSIGGANMEVGKFAEPEVVSVR